ncbi:nucleotidyltransferase family protein [Methylocystis echinoides]|uniref:nucleotidyltransferase family protein n=1 Tax=Methylocystis echinoides TaxID=29468 RepID=UPI003445CB80
MSVTSWISVVLLAAGRGSRFGGASNKLLADFDGRPLVRRAAEAALASRARDTIVVTGHGRPEIEAALAGLPLSFAHNPDFASGLASSLRKGLAAAAAADAVIVLLADMPGVSSGLIDGLIFAFEKAPEAPAIVPVQGGRRGNPALLAKSLFPRLMALEGDEGAKRLLSELDGVIELPVDEDVLNDVDVPSDLDRLRGQIRRS